MKNMIANCQISPCHVDLAKYLFLNSLLPLVGQMFEFIYYLFDRHSAVPLQFFKSILIVCYRVVHHTHFSFCCNCNCVHLSVPFPMLISRQYMLHSLYRHGCNWYLEIKIRNYEPGNQTRDHADINVRMWGHQLHLTFCGCEAQTIANRLLSIYNKSINMFNKPYITSS